MEGERQGGREERARGQVRRGVQGGREGEGGGEGGEGHQRYQVVVDRHMRLPLCLFLLSLIRPHVFFRCN